MAPSDISRRLAGEGIGTAILVATVVGSGIMGERLAGGNVAIALLANTIATGAILVVLISIIGPLSGAHFNPLVTLVQAARGVSPRRDVVPYILVQCIGGVGGTIMAHAMFDVPLLQAGIAVRSGPAQWLAEGVASFCLLFAILGSLRYRPEAIPVLVGLTITAAYWFTASTSFANPAVTLARSFTATFAGIRPGDVLPFVIAQIIGAGCAVIFAGWLFAANPAPRD